MENNYDVGIANRFALFMEEGENSLTAIRKKINKETRIKDKLTKKESTDTTKVEPVNTQEKPKKSAESKPATNDVTVPKKEVKDKKNEAAKGKDKKFNDNAKRKEKEPQDKNRSNKVNENGPQENEVKEGNNKSADSVANTRKNYENRKNRDKKFENNDQFQSKTSPTSSKKFTKDDWSYKEGNGDSNEHNQFEDDRNVKENGHGSYNDVKPRGGRVNRGGRGGRNNAYSGGDRRREFDQTNENRDEFDTNKNESNGENKAEVDPENTENQKDDKNETAESEGNETGEQKEVKEFLTLDEWKKKQGARQKPQYNLRKAGEGEDLTQWKNMRELQKKKDEAFLKNGNGSGNQPASNNENEDENAANENVQRVARQKHIDINVHFRDAPVRGRGGRVIRSNRFGYKGGNFEANENFGGEPRPFRKPRDAPPSGRGGHRQNAPKMDDEHAFPSLG